MPRKPKPTFRRWTPVVSITDLRDVPAGTKGKILMPVGISWQRYHVLFDNGVEVSSLDMRHIALDESDKKTGPDIATPWATPPKPRLKTEPAAAAGSGAAALPAGSEPEALPAGGETPALPAGAAQATGSPGRAPETEPAATPKG